MKKSLRRSTVLVAGGLGFIGSNLALKLAARGHKVVVFDNYSNGTGSASVERFESISIIRGDVLDPKAVERAVANVDIVFNLAVRCLPESLENPVATHMVNDIGTLNLCVACKKLKKRLVQVSSSEAYGTAKCVPMNESHPLDPTTPYGASKAASEMIVLGFSRCYGMEAVILRPFNAYGAFMREDTYSAVLPRFVSRARQNKKLVIFGDGHQTRDLTYVDDITEGMATAGEIFPSGEILNVARGAEVSVLRLAEIVIGIYRARGKFNLKDGLEFRPERQGDVRRHFADISKAKRILGFEAKVDINDGVNRYAEWFESTHPAN